MRTAKNILRKNKEKNNSYLPSQSKIDILLYSWLNTQPNFQLTRIFVAYVESKLINKNNNKTNQTNLLHTGRKLCVNAENGTICIFLFRTGTFLEGLGWSGAWVSDLVKITRARAP